MENCIKKRDETLLRLEDKTNELNDLETYAKSIKYNDLWGINRYASEFRKIRYQIRSLKQQIDYYDTIINGYAIPKLKKQEKKKMFILQ